MLMGTYCEWVDAMQSCAWPYRTGLCAQKPMHPQSAYRTLMFFLLEIFTKKANLVRRRRKPCGFTLIDEIKMSSSLPGTL